MQEGTTTSKFPPPDSPSRPSRGAGARNEPHASRTPPRYRRVRTVGPSGNYWYAVEQDHALERGEAKEVVFWKRPIAIYRGEDGQVRAVENRCAHRQLPLSRGHVEGDRLVCSYHGWKYDGCGRCVSISHELGKGRTRMPKIRIRSYPVRIAYGLIWIFPGDPELAASVPLPDIPQLEGPRPWPIEPIDITIGAHFTMIVENVCDFNHAYLHRRKQPFTDPKLREYRREGDTVRVFYDTSFAHSTIAKLASENRGQDLDEIELWYQYPYQGSNIAGKYLHWLFMLPVDERTTRCFFLFLFGPIEIPLIRKNVPDVLKRPVLHLANRLYIQPLLGEDKWALEAEQEGFDRSAGHPFIELNPIVPEFQKLTLEKWDEYQQSPAVAGAAE